jgi:hypothetical protein
MKVDPEEINICGYKLGFLLTLSAKFYLYLITVTVLVKVPLVFAHMAKVEIKKTPAAVNFVK